MKQCHCGSCATDSGSGLAVHTQTDPCGCEHEKGSRAASAIHRDGISILAAAALFSVSFLIPEGHLRMAVLLAAILTAGAAIFWQGLKNISTLNLEELALLTIAVTAACIIGEMHEALLVTVLFRIGNVLEELAVARSQREVEAVTRIIPDNANLLLDDGTAATVSARELAVGSRIRIKSGERVPVDSVVLSGESSVDSSSLTGESAPRDIAPGDAILSGMVNLGGVLTCETTSTFDNSTASRIVEMVKDSVAKKGGAERLISRFARVYTPIVIAVAVLVAVVPPLLGFGSFPGWISRSLVFLVASCPCALVISIPLSFFAGIGACSKNGILVKGSRYIEALSQTGAVAFDKTGTLTTGKLSLSGVYPSQGTEEQEVLKLAATLESYSNHPIAKAIIEAYGSPDVSGVESCEELTSYGMRAVMGGDEVLCGSTRLMEKYGIDISDLPWANVYVAKNSVVLGGISVCDSPRADAADAIAQLKELGIADTVMLTGDGTVAANKTAALIGVSSVHGELLPADKVSAFEQLKNGSSGKVLFVGDGINDSPVLARADAGVAMGLGSDAAIEAADVVLLSDKLSALPQAIRIARRTSRIAHFNIAFALGIKLLVFVLAFFGVASMWMAVFADVGVSILTVLNAARVLRFR